MILSKLGTSAARRRRTVPGVELGVRGFPVSRRGLVRRLACGLLASLLVVHLALFPVWARATVAAGALTAVGLGVTVTAFLNLSGIYPFNPDTGEGVDFSEWSTDALQKLMELYNVAHATAPITAQTIKSYALGATIAVANDGWNRLRDFVGWIRETYAPADSAQSVRLGTTYDGTFPVFSAPTGIQLFQDGLYIGVPTTGYPSMYGGASRAGVRAFAVRGSRNSVSVDSVLYASTGSGFTAYYAYHQRQSLDGSYSVPPWGASYVLEGETVYYYGVAASSIPSEIPRLESISGTDDFKQELFSALGGSLSPSLSGIIADTTTVTTPSVPVADSEFTGIQVGGLAQGATVEALEDVVESGVQNREQPTVRQVEVEVQAGIEVDSETGEVTENPVAVTPDSVPLVASDFSIPALHTVFPFSIPWDVYNVFSALNAEPVRPSFDASLYVPILDVSIPFKIAIPDEISEDVDSFVALARSLFLVLMCVATLLFVRELIR